MRKLANCIYITELQIMINYIIDKVVIVTPTKYFWIFLSLLTYGGANRRANIDIYVSLIAVWSKISIKSPKNLNELINYNRIVFNDPFPP